MTDHTMAEQPMAEHTMAEHRMAQLLAGVLDLTPAGAPPHPPRQCDALCVPACIDFRPGRAAPTAPTSRGERPMAAAEGPAAD